MGVQVLLWQKPKSVLSWDLPAKATTSKMLNSNPQPHPVTARAVCKQDGFPTGGRNKSEEALSHHRHLHPAAVPKRQWGRRWHLASHSGAFLFN